MDANVSLDRGRDIMRLSVVQNTAVRKDTYMIPTTTKYTTIRLGFFYNCEKIF